MRPAPAVPSPSASPTLATLAPVAGPVAVAAAGVAMLAWSWRTWPDPIVDYGRELYAAWQVAEGKTLYVDVAHFCGPLSVYLNALWMRLFGTSLMTVALANAAIVAAFTALLYALAVRLASRLAATAACLVFVTLFASAQYTRIGNYNWICPYAHELTHGTMLALAALWCLERYHRTGRAAWIDAMGFATGGLALTKVEPLVAGAAAIGAGLVLTAVAERPSPSRAAALAARFVAWALVPPALAFLWFVRSMPVSEVLRWPVGHWRAAAMPELATSNFYRGGLGIDDLAGNVGSLAVAAAWAALVAAIAIGAALGLRRVKIPGSAVAAAGVASAVVLWRLVTIDGWLAAARPLPLYAALAVVASLAGFVRHRADAARARAFALRIAFALFALAMLAKMALNTRIFHYGFVLAMPAAFLLALAAVEWIPAAVERGGGHGHLVRAVAFGAVVAAIAGHLAFVGHLLAPKVHRVGDGADAFYADSGGLVVTELLRELRTRAAPGDTIIMAPDGIMVNFLTRRLNPTPYYGFDRTSRLLWGEENFIRAIAEHPPEWFVVVDRGNAAPGDLGFGIGYYQDGRRWIDEHYRTVRQIGPKPFSGDGRPGALLMRRDDG